MSVAMELVTTKGTHPLDEYMQGLFHLDDIIMLPNYKTRSRRWTKYKKYIKQHFDHAVYDGDYLTLPCINKLWRQGWYFKKRLFKSPEPTYFAFTRADILRLMDKLVDTSDPAGKEAYEAFAEEEFVEGEDIFMIAW